MDEKQQKLEQFIRQILEIQNKEKSPILKTNDLKNIVLEMGMTESDWQLISETFNGYALRGKGFLEYKNWEDAIKEFEQAHTLNPYNTDILYGLALSHKNLWHQTNMSTHKANAERYAKMCININPKYKEAIALISEIKQPKNQHIASINAQQIITNQTTQVTNTKNQKLIVILIISIFVAILFIGFILYTTQSSNIVLQEPSNSIPEQTEITTTVPTEEVVEPEIPVIFIENEQSKGLKFILEKIEADDYTTSYNVGAKGYFKLENIEINELKIKADLLNTEDKVVSTKIIELVSDSENALRNGDLLPFEFSNYQDNSSLPKFKALRLAVSYIVKQEGNFKYAESKSKPINWAIEKPANYDISVKERINTTTKQFSTGIFHEITLEIQNTGNSNIKMLLFQIEWFDKKNNLAKSEEFYVVTDSYAPIKRGDVRIYDRTFGIDKLNLVNYKNYEVTVLAIN